MIEHIIFLSMALKGISKYSIVSGVKTVRSKWFIFLEKEGEIWSAGPLEKADTDILLLSVQPSVSEN
jgi:hypothetical protein